MIPPAPSDLGRFFSVSMYEGGTASGNERFSIGEQSSNVNDKWGMHFGSTATGRQETAASIYTESFLLARVDYHAGVNDDIYLWANYDLTLGEPTTASAHATSVGFANLAFDRVTLRAGAASGGLASAQGFFDELRIGTSYADVTPGGVVCELGDVNCDTIIDVENDFEAIRLHFRRTVTSRDDGDLTGDSIVDFDDFREWKTAFLGGGGSLEGVNFNFLTTPEPGSMSLLLLAALALIGVRKQRRNNLQLMFDDMRRNPVFLQFSKYQLLCATVAALAVAGWTSSASAVLQGYEGFNYADTTSILTQTGGGGWSDAWAKNGNAASTEIATAPGLIYSGLPAVGNKATLTGQTLTTTGNGASSFVFRSFNTNFGADNTTTWLSFIGQRTGTKSGDHGVGNTASYQRIYGISFFDNGIANTDERFAVGELSSSADVDDLDTWALNIFNPAGPGVTVPTAVAIDQQAFLLVRIDYGSGTLSDDAYLWVNPNLGARRAVDWNGQRHACGSQPGVRPAAHLRGRVSKRERDSDSAPV